MGMNNFIQFFRDLGSKKIGSNVLAGHGKVTPQSMSFYRQLEKEVRKKRDLSSPLNQLETVVFDVETTGFFPEKGDEIISIGAVKMKGNKILPKETFYSLIRLTRPLPPNIHALTGIDNEELALAPEASEVLMKFFHFISSNILVAHHAKHEQRFMEKTTRDVMRKKFQHRIIDTSFLTRVIDPTSSPKTLEAICTAYGIEVKNRHHALGDALMTAELWSQSLTRIQVAGFTTLGEVYEQIAKLDNQ